MGPIETRLESKIKLSFDPSHFELENESRKHSVPKNSETHFRAVLVSEKFVGVSRIQRQRLVLEAVALEMKEGVHAFTMRCLTPEEWAAGKAKDFASPDCHGGSKKS
ncbi:BolA/IbaG family iron-sulfur metabolism protein [soil metagenome]